MITIDVLGWTRLEPGNWGSHLERGLEARLHDPLWVLARQWQLGEFRGIDAGSPVRAELELEQAKLDRFYPGGDGEGQPYDVRQAPLEVLVEPEADGATLPIAFQAGRHLAELLREAGLDLVCEALVERYPLVVPSTPLDPRTEAYLRVAAGRVPDGLEIHRGLSQDPPELDVNADSAATAAEIFQQWLGWVNAGWPDLAAEGTCWSPEHLEYRFAVSAPGQDERQRLSVDEYQPGRLDWYSFAVEKGQPDANSRPETLELPPIPPASLELRGMPVTNWWEFEDGALNLDMMEAAWDGGIDLMLMELLFAFGEEWHLIPVDLEVGSLYRVHRLTVTDTFGVTRTLPAPQPEALRFALFHPTEGEAQLLLPPTLASRIQGDVCERVLFARDELANAAWAIEKTVAAGPLETPVDRDHSPATEPPPPAGSDPQELTYQLVEQLPANWLPLLPARTSGPSPDFRLHLSPQEGQIIGGKILTPPDLALCEEELPRSGLEVTRAPQRSRWLGGATCSWISRRRRIGIGELYRGIDFDHPRRP